MHCEGHDTIRNKSTVRNKDTTWDVRGTGVEGTTRNKSKTNDTDTTR